MTTPNPPARIAALSIRQPWAALILNGRKPVENRTWTTSYRGFLAVHAGKTVDPHAAIVLREQFAVGHVPNADERGFLGVVDLVDVHHGDTCRPACSWWAAPGCFHWILQRPRRLPRPIPGSGHLGLFTPAPDAAEHLRALAERR